MVDRSVAIDITGLTLKQREPLILFLKAKGEKIIRDSTLFEEGNSKHDISFLKFSAYWLTTSNNEGRKVVSISEFINFNGLMSIYE